MRDLRSRSPISWAAFAAGLASCVLQAHGRAQDRVELTPKYPLAHVAVHDLPGLRAAFAQTAAARLLAEPEVADAVDLARDNLLALGDRWVALVDKLRAIDAGALSFAELGQAEAWRAGVASLLDLQIGHAMEPPAVEGAAQQEYPPWMQNHDYLALRPSDQAKAALAARFDALLEELRKSPPPGLELPADQKLFGKPGLHMVPGGSKSRPDYYQYLVPDGLAAWALRDDDLLIGVSGGKPDIMELRPVTPDSPPSIQVTMEPKQFGQMALMMACGFFFYGAEDYFGAEWKLLGLDNITAVTWRLAVVDDRLQEDVSCVLPEPATGILGSFLQGMAPMPDQPLPEGAMLQVRCGFDVQMLCKAIDEYLLTKEQPTLGDLGVRDDLRLAWTGGIALALVRPAPGSLMPRVYASFGVADAAALQRVLGKLWEAWPIERKPRRYEDTDCTQLDLDGLPPGVKPTFALVEDTLHIADSATSLRALLRARAAGAPRALDVGKAPRPKGPGRAIPGVDIRYDAAAIHTVLQQDWLPLPHRASMMGGEDIAPLLPVQEMPRVATVAERLDTGRGVLRLDGRRLVFRCEGVFGGPTGQAITTALGPLLSRRLTQRFHYGIESLRARLACTQVIAVHKAIAAYEKRVGYRPETLGELLAAGDLTDASLLVLEGDERPEPVMHDGKQVAESSFRYYRAGLTVTPYDTEIKAQLISVPKMAWWRIASDATGTPHLGWGEFASKSLRELEKDAK